MGISKSTFFNKRQNRMASVAKALGHPARIAILEYLLKVQSCICNDLVIELPLAQATISQHLRALKNAELIKGNIEGNAICYCINEKTIEELNSYLESMKIQLLKINCC
ncbi:MAG: metalloregulator ArsR/SmtB family transcription factor [Bacteroidota bacterium]